MEKLQAATGQQESPRADGPGRFEAARAFAVEAARLAANTRCNRVNVLDVRKISPVTDFFVIGTGTSARQMRTVAEDLAELAATHNYQLISRSGYEGDTWILLDFVDVIVHIFNESARDYYDLDNLWGDARPIDWRPPTAQPERR
jgi:ribosome-associated protein